MSSKEVGEVRSRQTLYSLREYKVTGEVEVEEFNRISENVFLMKKNI